MPARVVSSKSAWKRIEDLVAGGAVENVAWERRLFLSSSSSRAPAAKKAMYALAASSASESAGYIAVYNGDLPTDMIGEQNQLKNIKVKCHTILSCCWISRC